MRWAPWAEMASARLFLLERGDVRVACEGYPPLKVNLRLKEVEINGLDGTILKAEVSRENADAGVKLCHLDNTLCLLSFGDALCFVTNSF